MRRRQSSLLTTDHQPTPIRRNPLAEVLRAPRGRSAHGGTGSRSASRTSYTLRRRQLGRDGPLPSRTSHGRGHRRRLERATSWCAASSGCCNRWCGGIAGIAGAPAAAQVSP